MSIKGKRLAIKKASAEAMAGMANLKLGLTGQPMWFVAARYASHAGAYIRRIENIRLTPEFLFNRRGEIDKQKLNAYNSRHGE